MLRRGPTLLDRASNPTGYRASDSTHHRPGHSFPSVGTLRPIEVQPPRMRRTHARLDHLQPHAIRRPMDSPTQAMTLGQRITHAYNLMMNARRSGETAAEQTYRKRVDELLERVPRQTRF